MPKQSYALEKDGPKRLEVSWRGLWKDCTVRLDDNVIGTVPGQRELKAGQEFPLPDGSVLAVQLVSKFTTTELRILRDGEPLPGSGSDPVERLKLAYSMIFVVAGLNIVLGLVGSLFKVDWLLEMGIGTYSVVFGLALLVLGIFTKRRSMAALIIAIALYALDTVLGVLFAADTSASSTMLVVRIVLIIPMFGGIGAIKRLKQQAPSAG